MFGHGGGISGSDFRDGVGTGDAGGVAAADDVDNIGGSCMGGGDGSDGFRACCFW